MAYEAKKDSGLDWYDNKWEVIDVNNKEKKKYGPLRFCERHEIII